MFPLAVCASNPVRTWQPTMARSNVPSQAVTSVYKVATVQRDLSATWANVSRRNNVHVFISTSTMLWVLVIKIIQIILYTNIIRILWAGYMCSF